MVRRATLDTLATPRHSTPWRSSPARLSALSLTPLADGPPSWMEVQWLTNNQTEAYP